MGCCVLLAGIFTCLLTIKPRIFGNSKISGNPLEWSLEKDKQSE